MKPRNFFLVLLVLSVLLVGACANSTSVLTPLPPLTETTTLIASLGTEATLTPRLEDTPPTSVTVKKSPTPEATATLSETLAATAVSTETTYIEAGQIGAYDVSAGFAEFDTGDLFKDTKQITFNTGRNGESTTTVKQNIQDLWYEILIQRSPTFRELRITTPEQVKEWLVQPGDKSIEFEYMSKTLPLGADRYQAILKTEIMDVKLPPKFIFRYVSGSETWDKAFSIKNSGETDLNGWFGDINQLRGWVTEGYLGLNIEGNQLIVRSGKTSWYRSSDAFDMYSFGKMFSAIMDVLYTGDLTYTFDQDQYSFDHKIFYWSSNPRNFRNSQVWSAFSAAPSK
jgi:hypothetical protein